MNQLATRCSRCRRQLQSKQSRELGMGPRCASLSGLLRRAEQTPQDEEPLVIQRVPFLADVRIWRTADGVHTNIRRSVIWHSPDGFEIGYGGSGPADLALNILNAFVPPCAGAEDERAPEKCYRGNASRFACRHHQAFKAEFIATMDRSGGTLRNADINAWIKTRLIDGQLG